MHIKDKLLKMYHQLPDSSTTRSRLADYQKMFRYGVLGELDENYFLFIYRDLFRSAAHYGAVIFLNKRDFEGNPVTVIGIEQDGTEQIRNVYVRAALYFLEEDAPNTLNIAGGSLEVFNLAKGKINVFIESRTPAPTDLDKFDFNVENQKITFTEIKSKKTKRQLENQNLKKQLELLEDLPEETDIPGAVKHEARLGLHLKVDFVDLSGKKEMTFQPLAVPLKSDGNLKPPKKLTPSEADKYQFIDLSPTLSQYLHHFKSLDETRFKDSLRTKVMSRLYFDPLVDELFQLNPELCFCHAPDMNMAKTFNPLERLQFQKIRVRFAPSFKKETVFRIRLKFQAAKDGPYLDSGDDYVIQITQGRAYILFRTQDGRNVLAVPQTPEPFLPFFHFLAQGNEFFTCDFDEVVNRLEAVGSQWLDLDSKMLKKYSIQLKPRPLLKVYSQDHLTGEKSRVEADFDYIEPIEKFLAKHPDKEVFDYQPDNQFQSMCYNLLKTDPLLQQSVDYNPKEKSIVYCFYFKEGDGLQWLIQRGAFYLQKGFRIFMAQWNRYVDSTQSQVRIAIKSDIDWLSFSPTIHVGDETDLPGVAVDEILPDQNMVMDKQGRLHLLTKKELDKLIALFQYGERHGETFRIPSRNHILVNKLYDERMDAMPQLEGALETSEKLKAFEKIADYPVSPRFNGELRDYQKAGFKWLRFLEEYRFHGCLADDMGLGKTVQTLALLQTLKDENKLKTSLLVVPVSAIPNWEMEIQKFTTDFVTLRHIGTKRAKDAAGWEGVDVVITSYATMRNDIDLFGEFQFDYVILDESQNIKNHASLVSKAARVLKGNRRLALSGTPIENSSLELWSLFDFLLPRYLGSAQFFARQFGVPIEKEQDGYQAAMLRSMIFPFIMRRRKEDVEHQLPEKTEILTKLQMEPAQWDLYVETAKKYRDRIQEEMGEEGVGKSSLTVLEGMLRLRQMCLFPRLVDESYSEIPSAKFEHFKGLLEEILSEDHKVLVFSQFVEALKELKNHLETDGIPFSYIDGSTDVTARESNIRRFQEDPGQRVFLLSLKAGGVAINLTAADYVIIFDPWWNPAVEAQAIDRSHRIGQTKKVFVYRMVIEGSIEEKMLKLQDKKRQLVEDLVVSDSKSFKNLKRDDILDLFYPGE